MGRFLAAPGPRGVSEVRDTQHHRSACRLDVRAVQRVINRTHSPVALGKTTIELDVVDAPLREGLHINPLVPETPGQLLACHPPTVLVEAVFQTFAVNVVANRLHATRELLRIRNQPAGWIPLARHPCVINDQVCVTRIAHAGGHHRVGDCLDLLFVNLLLERVPTVPAHRRRQGKTHGPVERLREGIANERVGCRRAIVMTIPVSAQSPVFIVQCLGRKHVVARRPDLLFPLDARIFVRRDTQFLEPGVPEVNRRYERDVSERRIIGHSFLGTTELHHGLSLAIVRVLRPLNHFMTAHPQFTDRNRHIRRIEVLTEIAKHGCEIVRISIDEAHPNAFAVKLEMPLTEVVPALEPGHTYDFVALPCISRHHVLDVGQSLLDLCDHFVIEVSRLWILASS